MSMQRNNSWIWDYVTLLSNEYVKCNICGLTYRIYRQINHLNNHIDIRTYGILLFHVWNI